jgi:hypothetical protein
MKRTSEKQNATIRELLAGHLERVEEAFCALERSELLRAHDPERGIPAMRQAIRDAVAALRPAALAEMRRALTTASFWHPDTGASLPADFDAAAVLLPEPGEGWLEAFCDFLIGLRGVLLAAVAALEPQAPDAAAPRPMDGAALHAAGSPRGKLAGRAKNRNGQPEPAPVVRVQNGASAIRPRLMTVRQTAEYLGKTEKAIWHQIAKKELPTLKQGRRVFVNVKELDRQIDANTELPQ